MKKRLPELDDIRGISIIVMIMIHTNAYFLSNWWSATTRDISQFAVVAFLFCSTYLSIQRPFPQSISELLPYVLKRLKRLILPFFVFFTVYVLLMKFGIGKSFPLKYIIESFLLIGGIDFNWLVLLFVQLMIITPLLYFLFAKKKILLLIYTVIAFISSVVFLKYTPLPYYRSIMWLPWSLVIIYTFYLDVLWKNKKLFFLTTFILGFLFLGTQQWVLVPLKHSLSQYANKYPPNLYHISYSLFALNILYYLSKVNAFSQSLVQKTIHFFSINSYTLFFIHILVIEVVWKWARPHNWIVFFLIVTIISVVIQLGMNKINEKMKPVEKK